MTDLKKLAHDLTDLFSSHLHYWDNKTLMGQMTYAEINKALEDGVKQYMNDPLFNAKVKSLTAATLETVGETHRALLQEVETLREQLARHEEAAPQTLHIPRDWLRDRTDDDDESPLAGPAPDIAAIKAELDQPTTASQPAAPQDGETKP